MNEATIRWALAQPARSPVERAILLTLAAAGPMTLDRLAECCAPDARFLRATIDALRSRGLIEGANGAPIRVHDLCTLSPSPGNTGPDPDSLDTEKSSPPTTPGFC